MLESVEESSNNYLQVFWSTKASRRLLQVIARASSLLFEFAIKNWQEKNLQRSILSVVYRRRIEPRPKRLEVDRSFKAPNTNQNKSLERRNVQRCVTKADHVTWVRDMSFISSGVAETGEAFLEVPVAVSRLLPGAQSFTAAIDIVLDATRLCQKSIQLRHSFLGFEHLKLQPLLMMLWRPSQAESSCCCSVQRHGFLPKICWLVL